MTDQRTPLTLDLRRLSEMHGPERAFTTAYVPTSEYVSALQARVRRIEALLADEPEEAEHFAESIKPIHDWLEEHDVENHGVVLFSCWALDFFEVHALPVPTDGLLRVDASPYIRPLAEIQDDHARYAVVVADSQTARILLVTTEVVTHETEVEGDVKGRTKKGGWSQKRYARRRTKALQQFGEEIAEAVTDLYNARQFRRLILLGQQDTLATIEAALPTHLQERLIATEGAAVDGADHELLAQARELHAAQERAEEQDLLDAIRGEVLGGGLGASGAEDVLLATQNGRAEEIIVDRSADLPGTACRACDNAFAGAHETCIRCRADDVYAIDVVEEITRHAQLTGADVEFADEDPRLASLGGVAAHLRW